MIMLAFVLIDSCDYVGFGFLAALLVIRIYFNLTEFLKFPLSQFLNARLQSHWILIS